MIEGTQLRKTALSLFAADTKSYVSSVLDLVTALEDDDEVTAMLFLLFVHFVSESAVTALKRITEQADADGS